MATDHIRYDVLTSDAMRGVLRKVLGDVATQGLPGEHHFFITFLSKAEGVKLSPRLLAQYPKEITIILQHQFWDLAVFDDRFEVGLSFSGVAERLVIPFSALKSFMDPSVGFDLQFNVVETLSAEPPPAVTPSPMPIPMPIPMPTASAAAEKPDGDDDPTTPEPGGAVVQLDRFRKK